MACSRTSTVYNPISPPFYECFPRKYKVAVPLAYVPPTSVGNYYPVPVPSYPMLQRPFQKERVWTPQPSYLNAIGNDPTHPLYFMSMNNLQRF